MGMDEETYMTAQWDNGKKVTIHFYNQKFNLKERQLNFRHFLPMYFDEMIGDKLHVRIADIGAGIFSTIGQLYYNGKDRVVCDVVASDLLADTFNQIIKERGVRPLVPIEKQDMENLTYPDESFDIVHCVNALDHCSDPEKAIREMVRVCKKGGWVYLRHYTDVAEEMKYLGLHQWNITSEFYNGCRIWNKDKSFNLFELGFKTSIGREFTYEPRNMVISKLHKL